MFITIFGLEIYVLSITIAFFSILVVRGFKKFFVKKIKKRIEDIQVIWLTFSWIVGTVCFIVWSISGQEIAINMILGFGFMTAFWYGGWKIIKAIHEKWKKVKK